MFLTKTAKIATAVLLAVALVAGVGARSPQAVAAREQLVGPLV